MRHAATRDGPTRCGQQILDCLGAARVSDITYNGDYPLRYPLGTGRCLPLADWDFGVANSQRRPRLEGLAGTSQVCTHAPNSGFTQAVRGLCDSGTLICGAPDLPKIEQAQLVKRRIVEKRQRERPGSVRRCCRSFSDRRGEMGHRGRFHTERLAHAPAAGAALACDRRSVLRTALTPANALNIRRGINASRQRGFRSGPVRTYP